MPEWLTITLPFVTALVGIWVGHRLAVRAARAQHRATRRVEFLMDALRTLMDLGDRSDRSPEEFRVLERALAEIALFGTDTEMEAVEGFVKTYDAAGNATGRGRADLMPVVNALRSSLREELGLENTKYPGVLYARFAESRGTRFKPWK